MSHKYLVHFFLGGGQRFSYFHISLHFGSRNKIFTGNSFRPTSFHAQIIQLPNGKGITNFLSPICLPWRLVAVCCRFSSAFRCGGSPGAQRTTADENECSVVFT